VKRVVLAIPYECSAVRKMPSSGMLSRVAVIRTDVSEERSASIIRVTGIGELGTTLALTSNRHMLRFSHSISSHRASVASLC
jgi:hypothetical protein